MGDTGEQLMSALIDAVIELAERRGQGPEARLTPELIRHYFTHSAPQDFVGLDPIDLYGAAARHLQLADQRTPTEALVRTYNPNSDEYGWASSHTVVDIVVEDMPFVVDSVLAFFERSNHDVHVLVHPTFVVERSTSGSLERLTVPTDGSGSTEHVESMVHVEIDRLTGTDELTDVEAGLRAVLADVRAAVEDWPQMRAKALEIAAEVERWGSDGDDPRADLIVEVGGEPAEVAVLLRWMEAGSFVFAGYREYDLVDDASTTSIVSRPDTGLGTLRQSEPTTRDLTTLAPEVAIEARRPRLINLTKANSLSTVHRSVPLDYVGIKEIDPTGRVTGERRFLGMFTSAVYASRVEDIPCVRVKVAAVVDNVDFVSTSHDHNRLLNTLQTYPRDELFQIGVDELEELALAILDLRDRRQVSLLLRRDRFGRFLSCLVFVPRDRHSTEVRLKIQQTLINAYRGTSVRYSTVITDAPLARLHIVIYTDPRDTGELPDTAAVEARLIQVTRTWDDFLRTSLIEAHGEEAALDLLAEYGDAFSDSYRSQVLAEAAVHDIDRLRELGPDSVDVSLHRPLEAGRFELRCKVYRSGKPIALSDLVPLFHDLGAVVVEQRPHEVRTVANSGFIYDFGLTFQTELDAGERLRIRESILAVWSGRTETDRLAGLIVSAGLSWREVAVLRAYARYLIQLGGRFSFNYLVKTLNGHPAVAATLSALFTARFDPARAATGDRRGDSADSEVDGEPGESQQIAALLNHQIDAVSSLDADRILRAFQNVIEATVRTNHWQRDADGEPRPALAFKIDPTRIRELPKPVPTAEIFVHSPRTEGVHLRSGPVARGGLRWSERMEDYRTEILGLMKAQSVKNSVIVPVGAKGGFIARRLPVTATRDQVGAEVVACYRTFVGALLDVTDNVIDDETVPPAAVVRHDGDDPYLVVAADKGTATFSDTANEIATDRGFWLGDAFASGGSAGYDHKALAITARGAWVSVRHHFKELGIDPAVDEFTVIGIGDMSGDVFGNGMLLSDKIRLVAAFDHRHVFIDPDPDAAMSHRERQRLFELDRSSWADYDPAMLSAGGGVFERSAKSVVLSPEATAALGLDPGTDDLTPDELIRAVLRAPVDLLWNGGIGTYIKGVAETDSSVGDRNNDAVRVTADRLRCKVIVEGGNLGVSQQGRIEFAQRGGRINTDAIDNSGGVDCSDHEVNLKILLGVAERNGDLTRKQRDRLLESMADEVCELVLGTNDRQNRTLANAVAEAPGMVTVHERLMAWLEAEAGLDRGVEGLPSSGELEERQQRGDCLTRPELAVLLAYTKNLITERLAAASLPTGDGAAPEASASEEPLGRGPRSREPLGKEPDGAEAAGREHRSTEPLGKEQRGKELLGKELLGKELLGKEPDGAEAARHFDELLFDYFPARAGDEYDELVCNHPLRNDLLAMLLSNRVVDRGGISMVHRLVQDTSATVADIALTHLVAWKIYRLDDLWHEVRALDRELSGPTQTAAELEIMKLGERATRWLLRNEHQPLDIAAVVDRYRDSVDTLLQAAVVAPQPDRIAERVAKLAAGGLAENVARRLSWLGRAYGFLDLSTVARRVGRPLDEVSVVHSRVEDELDLTRLREWVLDLPRTDHWKTMARGALRDQYFSDHAEITAAVLAASEIDAEPHQAVQGWLNANSVAVGRYRRTLVEIADSQGRDLAHVSVALRALTQLRRTL